MRLLQAVFLVVVSASPAFAQRQPVIVIPGKPGVPILLNGVDVSYAVIEGEFGLSRPIMVNPTVVYRPFVLPPDYGPDIYPGNEGTGDRAHHHGYFPSTGRRPGYGRLEILPPQDRPLPPPAPTFYRSWSSQSGSGPVTDYTPYPYPMPDVYLGTQFGPRGKRGQHHPHKPGGPGGHPKGP